MTQALAFFLALLAFLPSVGADISTKVMNGRVKELRLGESELVLSYRNPVSLQDEELVLGVSEGTGFSEGVRFEDLREGEPLSVDYEEHSDGTARAILIKRVPIRGAPAGLSR